MIACASDCELHIPISAVLISWHIIEPIVDACSVQGIFLMNSAAAFWPPRSKGNSIPLRRSAFGIKHIEQRIHPTPASAPFIYSKACRSMNIGSWYTKSKSPQSRSCDKAQFSKIGQGTTSMLTLKPPRTGLSPIYLMLHNERTSGNSFWVVGSCLNFSAFRPWVQLNQRPLILHKMQRNYQRTIEPVFVLALLQIQARG